MSKILFNIFLLSILVSFRVAAQNDSLDLVKASEYFGEARALSDIDNGDLWGMKLYGPILFVNLQNHNIIANVQDSAGYLKKKGEVFCGVLPNQWNVSNTTLTWQGTKWTMLVWPLPENNFQRKILLMHELFHEIQDKLNLPMSNTSSNHLDKKDGRILFRLEWKELVLALQSKGEEGSVHIRNAVLMNKYRKELYPGADTLESKLELNEGLAEYTGFKLSGEPKDSVISFWADRINLADKIPSFVRSFAYITTPMYGYLLDDSGKSWRDKIGDVKSLVDKLIECDSITFKSSIKDEAQAFIRTNSKSDLFKFETVREKKTEAKSVYFKQKFFQTPVIILRLENMNVQFDPRNLFPLDTIGTVYPNIRITDNWGVLTVTNEAFLSSDWHSVIVALPDKFEYKAESDTVKCDEWTLEIKKGWTLKTIPRKDSYTLVKEEK